MALFRLLVIGACIALVVSQGQGQAKGQGQDNNKDKAQKGDRKKPETKEDFEKKFGGPAGESDENSVLSTTKMQDAFDETTGQLVSEVADILTERQKEDLILLKNMSCHDGMKVFNLTRVTVRRALKIVELLVSMPGPGMGVGLGPMMPGGQGAGQSGQAQGGQAGQGGQGGQAGQNVPGGQGGQGEQGGQGAPDMGPNMQPEQFSFLAAVCVTNETLEAFLNVSMRLNEGIRMKAFHPNVLSVLNDELARRAATVLPNDTIDLLCERLKTAETEDLLDVARVFPCRAQLLKSHLRQMAQEDPLVADALLQEERKKRPEDVNWDEVMKDFGKRLPRDMLENAPAAKVKEHLSKVLDAATAPAVLPKIDFANMRAEDVEELGEKTCTDLPLSDLIEIPKEALEGAGNVTACVGKGGNKALKRKMAKKLLETRNAATCKKFLTDVDPTDAMCWKELSPDDVDGFDFKGVNKQEVSCEMAETLREKLNLTGGVNEWPREHIKKFAWLMRCFGPASVGDDEVEAMADAAAQEGLEDVELRPAVNRKVLEKTKEKMGNSSVDTAEKLRKVKGLVGAMTPSEVDQLPDEVVGETLPELKEEFKKMGKPSRRRLMGKVPPAQLKEALCDLGPMEEDVPADSLTQVDDLGERLQQENCSFKCHNDEQCAASYMKLKEALAANNLTWDDAPRNVLARASNTRAICGMPDEDALLLSAVPSIKDVAGAYFRARCPSSAATTQILVDKILLYNQFVTEEKLSELDAEILGGEFFKKLRAEDVANLDKETRKTIVLALGEADLSDKSATWMQEMAALALSTVLMNENADINSTAVLYLGNLLCGLTEDQISRITDDALLDAAETLSACPDHDAANKSRIGLEMRNKRSTPFSGMKVDDLSVGGNLFLADCSGLDQVSDAVKSDVIPDMAEARAKWEEMRDMQNNTQSDQDGTRQAKQDAVKEKLKCGLGKLVQAKARRRAAQSGQSRRRREAQTITCADIVELGQSADILTPEDIAALSASDFNNCFDVLGSITTWAPEEKEALANKAKEAWGAVDTWDANSNIPLLTAGTILQGLTPAELSNIPLTLDHLSALGQKEGWTTEQLEAGFAKLLQTVGGASSITADHLKQLGEFVCGATPAHIQGMASGAYRGAASEIGELWCGIGKMTAWANHAKQEFGSTVSAYDVLTSAKVGNVMAGMTGETLATLTPTQLSAIDIEAFAMIPPGRFSKLTVDQLQSLSTNHAQSVTLEQWQALSADQKQALQNLGLFYDTSTGSDSDNTGDGGGAAAKGAVVTVPLLLAMLLTVLFSV